MGICDDEGGVVDRLTISTDPDRGPADAIYRIGTAADALIARAGRPELCGVGVPGPLDVHRETLIRAVNLPGWLNIQLPLLLRERFGIPVHLENDANCATWGEYRAGIGQGSRSLVLFTLGTGIGGGIILHEELWVGSLGGAGRFGHVVIVPGGLPCRCGQRGCLEQYASATAVARTYGEGTAEDVFQAAARGDVRATEIIDRACEALAAGVRAAIQVIEPEMVVLGGGVAAAGDLLLSRVRERVRQPLSATQQMISIELSTLGGDAGWIGAALLAMNRADRIRSSPAPLPDLPTPLFRKSG